jgi:hypothetical protein
MQTEILSQIKRQIVSLDDEAKRNLADFLAEELKDKTETVSAPIAEENRHGSIEWLKQNREKYAGKYVALFENRLVGEGQNRREARERARENGFQNPFVTFVYSKKDAPFGGW